MKNYLVKIQKAIREELSIFTIVYITFVAFLLRGFNESFKNYEIIVSSYFSYKIYALSLVLVVIFNKRLRQGYSSGGKKIKNLVILLFWTFVTGLFAEAMIKLINVRYDVFSKAEEKVAKYYYLETIEEKNVPKYKVTFWAESEDGNVGSIKIYTDENMYKQLDKYRYGSKKDKIRIHYFLRKGFLKIPWVNKTEVLFKTDL